MPAGSVYFPLWSQDVCDCMPARIVASAKMQLHICFQVGERHRCRSKQFKQSIQISMRGMNIGMPMGRENGLSTGARNKLPRSARKSRVTGDPGLRAPNALRVRRLMQWLISQPCEGDGWRVVSLGSQGKRAWAIRWGGMQVWQHPSHASHELNSRQGPRHGRLRAHFPVLYGKNCGLYAFLLMTRRKNLWISFKIAG